MLRIGYVRLRDQDSADDTAVLKSMGCHVVRAEEPCAMPHADEETGVLDSILDFIGVGDQLVVTRLAHLGSSCRGALETLDKLEKRGATLCILNPGLTSEGMGGRTLRAALEAVAELEPIIPRRRRPDAREILEMQRAGIGPVEIARRLGVSRMTVWRKLKAVELQA